MWDHEPLTYVIVLNWNGWRDTLMCLDSLQDLDYPNYRTVVVDNGSTDGSVEHIHIKYPDQVVLESGTNLGFSAGNNLGIKYALEQGAEYIWLLNNDAQAAPQALSAMVDLLESNATVGAAASVIYDQADPQRVQAWGGGTVNLWTGTTKVQVEPGAARNLDYLTGASILLRASTLEDVGLLDEAYFLFWEDVELGFRIRSRGWQLAVAEPSRIWHKASASMGGEQSPESYAHYCKSAWRFFRHHATIPVVPLALRFTGGLLKWILQRDWRRTRILLSTPRS